MTQRNFLYTAGVLFLVGLTILLAVASFMESSVLLDGDPSSGWLNMVNLQHNAFHSWRFGHLTQLALYILPAEVAAERAAVSFAVLLLGTILLLRIPRPDGGDTMLSLTASMIPPLVVLLAVGVDPMVFGALCWMPIMTVVTYHLLRNPNSNALWLILGVVSVENSFCANQVSTITVILSVCLAAHLHTTTDQSSSEPRDTWIWLWAVLLVPAIITTIISPMPFLPHYPKSAHVVAYESTEGYLKPLIGPAYPFFVLDRANVRALYGFTSQVLLALSGALLLLARIRRNPLLRRVTFAALYIALAATLDTVPREEFTIISPIASISRLLPWGTTFSLTSLAVGVSAFALGCVVAFNRCPRSYIVAALASIAIVGHGAQELYRPLLRVSGLTNTLNLTHVVRTPSAGLIRMLATQQVDVTNLLPLLVQQAKLPTTPLASLQGTVSITPAPSTEALAQAKQLEQVFRWSARRGSQLGDEILTVRFPQKTTVRGVDLDPGAYATDYPRGLLIAGGDCDKPQQARTLYEAPIWQGSLEVTARGVPYFSPRNKVRVMFYESISLECIFVHQTARAPFDWSIATIGIIE